MWDTVKAVLRGKFIAIQAHLKKQEKSQKVHFYSATDLSKNFPCVLCLPIILRISRITKFQPVTERFFNPSAITGGDSGDEEENMCG